MYETPERIFVVMEKLKGDMLEMILHSTDVSLPVVLNDVVNVDHGDDDDDDDSNLARGVRNKRRSGRLFP